MPISVGSLQDFAIPEPRTMFYVVLLFLVALLGLVAFGKKSPHAKSQHDERTSSVHVAVLQLSRGIRCMRRYGYWGQLRAQDLPIVTMAMLVTVNPSSFF